MTKFHERFKEERIISKITQQEIADVIGVDRTSISKYENGKQLPEVPVLEKIADYFNVSSDYLLGRTDSKNKKSDSLSNENDIEKIIDEILHNNSLTLGGEQISGKDLELLKNSLRSTIDMAKNMNKK